MKKIITLIIITLVAVMNTNAELQQLRRHGTEFRDKELESFSYCIEHSSAYLHEPSSKLNVGEFKETFDTLTSKYLKEGIEVKDAIDTVAALEAISVTIWRMGINDTTYGDWKKSSVIMPLSIQDQRVVRNKVKYVVLDGFVYDLYTNSMVDIKENVIKFLKPEYKSKYE